MTDKPTILLQRDVDRLIEIASEQRERAEKAEQQAAALTAKVAELEGKHLPMGLFAEYGRLDVMWQQLVRERDEAKRENAALTQELAELEREVGRMVDARMALGNDLQDKNAALTQELARVREALEEARQFVPPAIAYGKLSARIDAALARDIP